MNRPFILGLTGAAVVGAALGLNYLVDSEAGVETAAVLKTPLNVTTKPDSPPMPSSIAPRPKDDIPPLNSTAAVPPLQSKAIVLPQRNNRLKHVQPQQAALVTPGKRRSISPNKPTFVVPTKPTFDVVRVNPRGDAVIAGRAAPNSSVIVRDGQKEVGKAKADARGEWVVIPKQPLPKGSRELTLSAKTPNGTPTQSDRNVVIMVPDQSPSSQKAGTDVPKRATGALAVLVPRRGKAGSIVIQKPSGVRPPSLDPRSKRVNPAAPVSIDSVDYDDAGNVTISGNAAPRAPLSVYIDNRHAASGVSDKQGRWRVVPGGELSPGDYTLRVDNVGAGGKVIGRAETQFTRANPATASPANTVVSVEVGNSLWRIARRVYGAGVQYSVIYDANREQIRNPDLIYPGQVFFVPHVN